MTLIRQPFLDFGQNILVKDFRAAGGLKTLDEWVLQAGEDLMTLLQKIPLFKLVGVAVTDANASQRILNRKLKKENEIRLGGKGLVQFTDLEGIETTNTLIGHGGEVVAVEDDRFLSLERREDEGFDVLAAVLDEKIEFFLWREAASFSRAAEAGPDRAICRLFGKDDVPAGSPESCREALCLGRLAGAVNAFEDDEHIKGGGRLTRAKSDEGKEESTPDRTRTCNPRIRSAMLYPVELRARLGELLGC